MDEKAFPAYLQAILDEHEWTWADLARESGIDATRLSRWKSGASLPSIENARQLAAAARKTLLDVLLGAGLITAKEARARGSLPVDLTGLTDDQILAEVRRRMSVGDKVRTLSADEIATNSERYTTGRPKKSAADASISS